MGSSREVKRADSCTWDWEGGEEAVGLSSRSLRNERFVGGWEVYCARSCAGAPKVDTADGMEESGGGVRDEDAEGESSS